MPATPRTWLHSFLRTGSPSTRRFRTTAALSGNHVTAVATTDRDGRYLLKDLPLGLYTITRE